ncbi:PREDICTED: uncharacterized protein LOC104718758 isoform X2 [Camelina sativa]|uniref:Uncharacterized protein LOC104718758 isoform X2 n=1 Tax=Camelina sativa TaxID=90675 RepID=A0ABM0U2I2_CAMSA|nr:PREDICTED: uncharacterized protein LOC104718758 isoform X2 [Camelina sativa]
MDARLNEVVVYEANFASGFRGVIPSLIAKMANEFSISPGQFSLLAWRVLMATQAFGESHSLDIGANEVLYAYYFNPLVDDIGRYSIHSRRPDRLVFDVGLFEKRRLELSWPQKYLYMRVGYNPGFPTDWFDADIRAKSREEGKEIISKVLLYNPKYRSIAFLTSSFVLEHCSFWGFDMSNGQRLPIPDSFASFLAAHGKLTEAIQTNEDSSNEMECVEVSVANKRKAPQAIPTPSFPRRARLAHGNTASTVTVPCQEILTSTDSSSVIEQLKNKVFSHDFDSLDADGTAALANGVYNDLLKVMSSFHLVERKLSSTIVEVAHERLKVDSLQQRLDHEKKESRSLVVSKDETISCLEGEVKERDLMICGLQTDATKSMREKELLLQEIETLKKRIDYMKNEHDFFMNGAAIIAHWEALGECLLSDRKEWNLADADMQYVHVMEAQEKFKGLPLPTFEVSLVAIAENSCEPSPTQP